MKVSEANDELIQAKNELKTVTRQISTIIRLVSESDIDISTAKDGLKELENRKKSIESYINETKVNTAALMIDEKMIQELISRSKDFIKTKNMSECRGFIENYIKRVIISGTKVEVKFKVHVPTDDGATLKPLRSETPISQLQERYI